MVLVSIWLRSAAIAAALFPWRYRCEIKGFFFSNRESISPVWVSTPSTATCTDFFLNFSIAADFFVRSWFSGWKKLFFCIAK